MASAMSSMMTNSNMSADGGNPMAGDTDNDMDHDMSQDDTTTCPACGNTFSASEGRANEGPSGPLQSGEDTAGPSPTDLMHQGNMTNIGTSSTLPASKNSMATMHRQNKKKTHTAHSDMKKTHREVTAAEDKGRLQDYMRARNPKLKNQPINESEHLKRAARARSVMRRGVIE